MAGINDILYTARSGILVNQKAIQITGNNVSNVNTPGYSRQQVTLSPAVAAGYGLGVSMAQVRRVHDGFLTQQVNLQAGTKEFLVGRQFVAQQLETVLPEVDNLGVNSALTNFFNSFKELSNNVSGNAERQMVAAQGEALADKINQAYNGVVNIQRNLNQDIEAEVERINTLMGELADLNQKVAVMADPTGATDNAELRDRRDQVVKQLYEMADVTTFTDNDGHINLMIGNHIAVQGTRAAELTAVAGNLTRIELNTLSGTGIDITERLSSENASGRLSGVLYERDIKLEEVKDQLDQLAYSLAEQVNLLHRGGFALDGSTDRDFFVMPADVAGAAGSLAVNQEILDNPSLIAAAQDAAAAHGDNRNAVAIAELMNDSNTVNGSSFHGYYTAMVGQVSSELSDLEQDLEIQTMVTDQAEAYQASVSGVSIDEEMVSLIQFQRAFEASAKIMNTVDEMLQQILALKQ